MSNQVLITTVIALSIILIFALCIAIFYLISIFRRLNIVLKKVDYLVEDITYKSESLNVGVDAINKVANYVLTFDTLSKKGLTSFAKIIAENRNYIFSFAEKLRKTVVKDDKKSKFHFKDRKTTDKKESKSSGGEK